MGHGPEFRNFLILKKEKKDRSKTRKSEKKTRGKNKVMSERKKKDL